MLSVLPAKYGDHEYNIIISENAFENFTLDLNNYNKKNILFILDKKIVDISFVNKFLQKYLDNTLIINGGISSKGFNTVNKIINFLNKKNITRDSCIVAIGGGVVCDIVSFVSSIYQRGIKLMIIPTTTTSMMDSCVGGKTGINHNNIVNLIGTYYHPISIYIDLRFLFTLTNRDYRSGIAESIKKGIVIDKNLFDFLLNNSESINARKLSAVFEMIHKSVDIKLRVTSSDVFEKSSRLLLNYGHTFGQSIESVFGINHKKLTHGYAVSLGMICAAKMSDNIFKKNLFLIHKEILEMYKLPTKLKLNSYKKLIDKMINNLNNDKKRTKEGVKFILSKSIGEGVTKVVNDKTLIKNSFRQLFV